MATALNPSDLERFEAQLRQREAQLRDEMRAGGRRSATETFERVAGEAPDAADAALAEVTRDALNAERERDSAELLEVQAALERIKVGTYGICLRCGEPIDRRRLQAAPTARYDVEHEAEQERTRGGVSTPRL